MNQANKYQREISANKYLFIFTSSILSVFNSYSPAFAQATAGRQTTTLLSDLHDTLQPKIKNLPVVATDINGSPLPDQSPSGTALFTTYDTDNGLALDALGYGKSILSDSKGNLWFGTQGGGVSKYDGKSFKSSKLKVKSPKTYDQLDSRQASHCC